MVDIIHHENTIKPMSPKNLLLNSNNEVTHAISRSNMRMAPSRYTTIWGGSSLLSMLLACIKDLLTISQWKWDFVLNLSESDYPVKTRLGSCVNCKLI